MYINKYNIGTFMTKFSILNPYSNINLIYKLCMNGEYTILTYTT